MQAHRSCANQKHMQLLLVIKSNFVGIAYHFRDIDAVVCNM